MRLAATFLSLASITSIGAELHEAAGSCDVRALTELIGRGLPVNETDGRGETPLHKATRNGKPQCVYALLDAGANKYLWNYARQPVHLLARLYPEGMIRDQMLGLLDSRAITPGEGVDSALHRSVLRGHVPLASLFLDMGANPSRIGKDGNTPLHNACLKGLDSLVTLMLKGGADPEQFSADGTLPLHDASLGGNVQVVSLLLAHGADASATTKSTGETPLHLAASWNRVDVAKALLAAGARRDARDARARTPLDTAVTNGNIEVAALLRTP